MITDCKFEQILDILRYNKGVKLGKDSFYPIFRSQSWKSDSKDSVWVWMDPSNNLLYLVTPKDISKGLFELLKPKTETRIILDEMLYSGWDLCYGKILR